MATDDTGTEAHTNAGTDAGTDAALAERVRRGERDALGVLFIRYYADLCAYAASVAGPDSAEDVVADVFQRLWARHAQWNPEHGPAVYLYGAVRNAAHNVNRTRRTRARRISEEMGTLASNGNHQPDTITSLEGAEARTAIVRAIDAMPEPRRTILHLRWLRQLSFAEIAGMLGMNRPAVQMHVTRALRTLRDQLGEFA